MPHTWDSSRRRYVNAKGRDVDPEKVRETVKAAQKASRARLRGWAEDYKAGRINRAEFFVRLNTEITRAHSAVGVIVNGGKAQMTPAAWGRVGKLVSEQRRFSRRFSAETLTAEAADFPVWRAESYAAVYGQAYENLLLARELGRKVERRLGASEKNCEDCPALVGVYDADKAPQVGADTVCGPGCNCYYVELDEVAT